MIDKIVSYKITLLMRIFLYNIIIMFDYRFFDKKVIYITYEFVTYNIF